MVAKSLKHIVFLRVPFTEHQFLHGFVTAATATVTATAATGAAATATATGTATKATASATDTATGLSAGTLRWNQLEERALLLSIVDDEPRKRGPARGDHREPTRIERDKRDRRSAALVDSLALDAAARRPARAGTARRRSRAFTRLAIRSRPHRQELSLTNTRSAKVLEPGPVHLHHRRLPLQRGVRRPHRARRAAPRTLRRCRRQPDDGLPQPHLVELLPSPRGRAVPRQAHLAASLREEHDSPRAAAGRAVLQRAGVRTAPRLVRDVAAGRV